MKPFDLAAAKRGEKLVTRDGREVTDFHHSPTHTKSAYTCAAIVGGERVTFTETGREYAPNESHGDLMLAPKVRTVYVQIFNKATDTDTPSLKAVAFENKGDAEDNLNATTWPVLVVALPVEIEE